MKIKIPFFLLILFCTFPVFAQNFPANDTQWWNEISISKPLVKAKDKHDKSFDRLSLNFTEIFRFGNNVKLVSDHRIGFGFDFKINPNITLTSNYLYIYSKPKLNTRDYENRFGFAVTFEKKFGKITLKDRNLLEYRAKNSKPNSFRYRNRFTFSYQVTKDKKEIFSPFISVDPHYDFAVKKWNRNELFAGITRKINKNLSLDIFYLRQDNISGLPKTINGFGLGLKIKLD